MECPFVFSSSAEIPVFCPREQCPLHVFSLEVVSPERTPAGTSIAWRFSRNSTKVTVFPKNTWTTLLYLLFLSPSSVLFYVLLYFILFIYFSFILSHYPHVRQNNVLVVATIVPDSRIEDELSVRRDGWQLGPLGSGRRLSSWRHKFTRESVFSFYRFLFLSPFV